MQVPEAEMNIPLIDHLKKPGNRRLTICIGVLDVLLLVGCFLQISVFPAPVLAGDGNPVLVVSTVAIVLGILGILLSALLIFLQVRRLRTPHHLRINQEGIFYSYYLSTFVRWDEITALVPYGGNNAEGRYALCIVLRDEATVIARFVEANSKNSWQKILYSFLMRLNLWTARALNAPSPVALLQSVLPLSIDELITAIQERFTTELHEHRITIRV